MAFPILDTPQTELGDHTRLTHAPDNDFSTENSIPSPSKDGNDLLRQIRGMRAPEKHSPRSRIPLTDRRNIPTKNEFTPLLKSATKNRFAQSSASIPERENGKLRTPKGLKDSYGGESPQLPLNSSVIAEEHTGSSATGADEKDETPMPQISSSSALSTPMVAANRRGDGPLDHHGNLATLREQEARLEQIDKENFSLKLKIHFLEEAMRKNGKEFNEAAIKENTELKVDKVTLQRDLKHYRKQLTQAERDLEEYKKQLLDYAEKVKRRHANESMLQELDQLRQTVAEKEAHIEELRNNEKSIQDARDKDADIERLRDEIADLEADVRDRDRQLDEKDEDLHNARVREPNEEDLEQLRSQLQEKDDEVQGLQDALRRSGEDSERRLADKDRLLEEKEDELNEMEEQMKSAGHDNSFLSRNKEQELQRHKGEIEGLQTRLDEAKSRAGGFEDLKEQCAQIETELTSERQAKTQAMEDKDNQIRNLQQKIEAADNDDDEIVEKLQDQVHDLEADLREQQRLVDEKEDEKDELQRRLKQFEAESDEELMAAQDRIQELETAQERHVKELQCLRDEGIQASSGRSHALESAQSRIEELERQDKDSLEAERKAKKQVHELQSRISDLEREVDDERDTARADTDWWQEQRRNLEGARVNAEDKVRNLERTITHLQQSEGTLSGRESHLQRALDSEKKRFSEEQALLQKDLDEASEELEEQRRALREANSELKLARLRLDESQKHESELRDQMQGLEDEIEVLQSSADQDAERAQDELHAARQEAESHRKQIKGLQQDVAKAQTEYRDVKNEIIAIRTTRSRSTPSPLGSPRAKSDLRIRSEELSDQLVRVKNEKQNLQSRLAAAESARADLDTLHFDLQASSDTRSTLQHKLSEAQSQLSKAQKDNWRFQEKLSASEADQRHLQSSIKEAEEAHIASEKTTRDLRAQLQTIQRENDRRLQAQIADYERDIRNLEQDLEDAHAKHHTLSSKLESAESYIAKYKSRIAALDTELAQARSPGSLANSTGRNSVRDTERERKDLQSKLNDAKARMEDLDAQLLDSNTRLQSASHREDQLRTQLRAAREERTNPHGSETTPELKSLEKKHALELRGLARQIEYLTSRCRREEAFRADLAFAKRYFLRCLEVNAKCARVDLGLLAEVGVPVKRVLEGEVCRNRGAERSDSGAKLAWEVGNSGSGALQVGRKAGVDRLERRKNMPPPSLKLVGTMVLAALRIQRAARMWKGVRERHDVLVKKLGAVRRDRGQKPGAGSARNAKDVDVDESLLLRLREDGDGGRRARGVLGKRK